MTENYAGMLGEVANTIRLYIDQKGYDVRSLNSDVYSITKRVRELDASESKIHEQLKDICFVNLLTTQILGFVSGARNYMCGFDEGALLAFPAWSIVKDIECKARCNLKTKWIENGGVLLSGKMIALKSDPIWRKMSLFGYPFPPFNYCKCCGVEDIDYDKCKKLKIVDRFYNAGTIYPYDFITPSSIVKNIGELDSLIKNMCDSPEVKKLLKSSF